VRAPYAGSKSNAASECSSSGKVMRSPKVVVIPPGNSSGGVEPAGSKAWHVSGMANAGRVVKSGSGRYRTGAAIQAGTANRKGRQMCKAPKEDHKVV